jgi:mono/diheme cytochrome c family protein
MRHTVVIGVFMVALSLGLVAPNSPAGAQPAMNAAQHEGLRLFSQSCGVCHTVVQQRTKQYGPVLSRNTLGGDEDLIREYISNGTPRMPGFRYTFNPEQITDIVQYIKTIPPQPAPANAR